MSPESDGPDPAPDPGWKLTPGLFLFLLPGYSGYHARRHGPRTDGLATLRQMWSSFALGAVLFGIVVLVVVPGSAAHPAGPWVMALAGLSLACLLTLDVVSRRSLGGSDGQAVALAYRTRFFVQIVLAEGIALAAFVAAFVTGTWWLYWLFLPFTLFGYARSAPTAGQLRREQHHLDERGLGISLVAALRTTPPAP